MGKVKRTYRFDSEIVDEVHKRAEGAGITDTQFIEDAIRAAIHEPDVGHAESQESHTVDDCPDWHELYLYERERHRLVEDTLRDELGEIRKSLQASQVLQGRELMGEIVADEASEPVPDKPSQTRMTLGQRVKLLFTGRIPE